MRLIARRNDSADRKLQEKKRAQKKEKIAIPNSRVSYSKMMSNLLAKYDPVTTMSLAVGGDYEGIGCGSGRLAYARSRSKYCDTIRYVGIDTFPALSVAKFPD